MFIGFIEAGVPLGATFSFLISSPVVNEIALILLIGLFGWKIAALYIGTGLVVAILAGMIIGWLNLESLVEPYVFGIKVGNTELAKMTWRDRHVYAKLYTFDIIKKVGLYVIIGVGLGAVVHGYVPVDLVSRLTGKSNLLAVPLAVIIGVPLYANCAGSLPVVQALIGKGMPIGTALAFMMSVTALSLPEFMILRRVMKVKLLAIYAGIVTIAIIIVGYLFNYILV